jgi:hypothetical protein
MIITTKYYLLKIFILVYNLNKLKVIKFFINNKKIKSLLKNIFNVRKYCLTIFFDIKEKIFINLN